MLGTWLAGAAIIAWGGAPQSAPRRAAPTPSARDTGPDSLLVSDSIYQGWKWFHVYCYRCHGEDAIGGVNPAAPDLRWVLNPGSVGQPRDGDPRASYLVLDLGAGRASFRRVAYDVELTQREIREEGLPETLAARLATGV